jgi:hypothetical protein
MDDKGRAKSRVYDEFIQLIAQGGGPEAVVAFHPSDSAQQRAYELVDRKRAGSLTPEEESELSHFLQLEHLVRMAKIRARMIQLETIPAPAQAA